MNNEHPLLSRTLVLIFGIVFIAVVSVQTVSEPDGGSSHTKPHDTNKESVQDEHSNDPHGKKPGHQGHEKPGSHKDKRSVTFSSDQIAGMDLEVGTPDLGTAQSRITRPATIQFDPDRIAKVGPVVSGRVQKVMVVPGDTVQKGDPLVRLHSVKLGRAKAAYLAEKASVQTKKSAYDRKKTLHKKEIASKAELQMARANYLEARSRKNEAKELLNIYGLSGKTIRNVQFGSEKSLATIKLRAPISGTIQKRTVSKGDVVKPGDHPIHIVNTERVWVMVDAYEKDLSHIQTGDGLTFVTKSHPEERFSGTVEWISRKLDRDTRTAKLRAQLDNTNGLLRAGMFGEATIQTQSDKKMLMIPVDAVQTLHGNTVVFTPAEQSNRFRIQPVRTGNESEDGWVEIVDGLSTNQKVVISGAFDLKSAFSAQTRSAAHNH